MILSKNCRLGGRDWRGLLAVTVIAAVTVGLATRFSAPSGSQLQNGKAVVSRSTEPQRQHFNSDAIRWVTPVASSSLFRLVTLHAQITPADPLIPDHVFAQALYNRPPPSSLSL